MLFRHAKQNRDRDALRYEGPKLVVAVVVFLGVSAVIPLYNKVVFDGVAGDKGFPYPLTTTLLQLGFTAVALTVGDALRRAWRVAAVKYADAYAYAEVGGLRLRRDNAVDASESDASVSSAQSEPLTTLDESARLIGDGLAEDAHASRRGAQREQRGGDLEAPGAQRTRHHYQERVRPQEVQEARGSRGVACPPGTESIESGRGVSWSEESYIGDPLDQSWIFGPELWYKFRITMPIGTLFGAKYAVTNVGLKLMPLAPHLLLQATDLMFTVLFAHMINRERLNRLELTACVGSTLGTVLVAYRTNQILPPGTGLYAITVNLVSPILLGLCVTLLRKASHHLLVREAGPFGRVPGMNPVELTAIKLWWSCFVIFPFVILFEDGGLEHLGVNTSTVSVPVSEFARNESPALWCAALGGGIFILVFQVNMTWMSTMATAVTVGVIGSLKIFPQWIVAVLFARSLDLSWANLSGATMLLGFSLLWTYSRYDSAMTDSRLRYKSKPTKRRSESIRRQIIKKGRATSGYGSTGGSSSSSSANEATATLARQAPS
ncbi:Hypothetical Protein FCC1311_080372 [Hondaea fermentalgiana]|uniref:Uncharacterized protein n=1 Tax=Hondaea fermentalgiana TaxID=2315210 RepID=A0A2R5GLN2_9STRA|nr:Hypothetical Protein FCC1311_080372 [Hondaea fermentalgiana]|eukprot:GBG31812.1 Hypothetical Protein FCC1311_080372 [Hondaea fermentalgiana]